MTLVTTGAISASMINTELGREMAAILSLNSTVARALVAKPTGTLSFSDFYGKSATPTREPASGFLYDGINFAWSELINTESPSSSYR